MKAKQIIETILDNCLDNSKCGFVRFSKDEDLKEQVERIFGHPSCYYSLAPDVEYLWYWPGGQAENVFVYADAGISIEVDGEIDQIYLMKVEDGKMNYEKKYKEMKARVLEIGRGYVKGVDFSKPRQIAEYIDPELKESGKINNK